MIMVKLENIYKTYISEGEEIHVLNGIDLEVEKGEIISIEGASGSGKSTLLNIIGIIDKPDQGNLWIDNIKIDVNQQNKLDEIRALKIGFIFQHYYLLPDFNILENVMMPLWIMQKRNVIIDNIQKQAKELLDLVGLSHRLYYYPSQISGGEMARATVARALVGNKKLILADEPTGNLDQENSYKIIDLLWNLQKKLQFTLIIVTHDRELAEKIPKRYKLDNGKLQSIVK
ncbi:MAG: ABC transporter ATP-binding protein [Leptospiraceae bacterium]|jgi:lipoprotein-releasing system ATP-binding protein|nr:ABC transporter ATP-binding protein [Leptospiraceae bacterium]